MVNRIFARHAGLLALLVAACGAQPTTKSGPSPIPETDGVPVAMMPATPAMAPSADGAEAPLVVFLGDSLSAGLGLAEEQAFPALVGERLRAGGLPIRVVNAGVSGDTSAGGLRRLEWVLKLSPDIVVVELGANDGLRGQPPEATEANLRSILERIRAAGARALLAGMMVPPNLGDDYAERFAAIFPRLARELDVALIPFLLEGVAAEPELNLPDGIHPNAAGHERVAETVAPYVAQLLREDAR